MEILPQWSQWTWVGVIAAVILAAVAHGAIGFGYPLISTPLVALITDVRTAVLTTLLPNVIINLISIVRGGAWRDILRRFWPVAAYVLLGTIVGTRVLAIANAGFLELLLAGMIVAYLLQDRMRGVRWHAIARFPRLAPLVFGSLAGFFSGTVNVAVPPLLVYFSALNLTPVVMTQALNLAFLVGRSTQVVAFTSSGALGSSMALTSVPVTVISLLALSTGFRLQQRIRPAVFTRILRVVLWAMATALCTQAMRAYLR